MKLKNKKTVDNVKTSWYNVSRVKENQIFFYNQMNDHLDYKDYKYDSRRSEDAKNLEAIIKNNDFHVPWEENETISEITDWFYIHSQP